MAYQRLSEVAQDLEDDDFTVSTVDTTSTDYRVASRVVNAQKDYFRYQGLIPVNMEDKQVNQSQRRPMPKQVDPQWLARRQQGGPTAKDASILFTPDPLGMKMYMHILYMYICMDVYIYIVYIGSSILYIV
jgi:hypothetical protein